ncbi:glycosyltransferase family 4 protein [Arthrobacter sp. TMT4-20]
MRILHVTECYGGGVSRAINSIVENSRQHEHILLWSGPEEPSLSFGYQHIDVLPKLLLARVNQVGKAIIQHNIDIVWAHSSWAGLYTRLVKRPVPVIYQPHCFVFTDPSRNLAMRAAYWGAEYILARNGDSIVALTEAEERFARPLVGRSTIRRINNVSTLSASTRDTASEGPRSRSVVMSGRIAVQKDPKFYAQVARRVRLSDPGIKFTWIGSGDDALTQALSQSGVEVTGWLDEARLRSRLEESSLYFHSAGYEGFPLSVIDAAEARTPVIVRDLPCFRGSGLESVKDVSEASEKILSYFSDPALRAKVKKRTGDLLRSMSPEKQQIKIENLLAEMNSLSRGDNEDINAVPNSR